MATNPPPAAGPETLGIAGVFAPLVDPAANSAGTAEGLRGVAVLKGLEDANLSNTKISDTGLKHNYGLKKLRRVNVTLPRHHGRGVQEFRKTRPGIELLHDEFQPGKD